MRVRLCLSAFSCLRGLRHPAERTLLHPDSGDARASGGRSDDQHRGRAGHCAGVGRPAATRGTGRRQPDSDLRVPPLGEPLKSEIARVIADNLAEALGTVRVWSYTQTGPANPDYRVLVDVQRFDSTLDDAVAIDALWTIRLAAGGAPKPGARRCESRFPASASTLSSPHTAERWRA